MKEVENVPLRSKILIPVISFIIGIPIAYFIVIIIPMIIDGTLNGNSSDQFLVLMGYIIPFFIMGIFPVWIFKNEFKNKKILLTIPSIIPIIFLLSAFYGITDKVSGEIIPRPLYILLPLTVYIIGLTIALYKPKK